MHLVPAVVHYSPIKSHGYVGLYLALENRGQTIEGRGRLNGCRKHLLIAEKGNIVGKGGWVGWAGGGGGGVTHCGLTAAVAVLRQITNNLKLGLRQVTESM